MSVVDAGVVCKLLLEEAGSDQAQELASTTTMAAPELIISEVCNVLWKRVRFSELSEEEAFRAVAELVQIPILLADSRVVAPLALEIAFASGRTAYDCLYVSLAVSRGEQLVTTDRRLFNSLSSTRWHHTVRMLGED